VLDAHSYLFPRFPTLLPPPQDFSLKSPWSYVTQVRLKVVPSSTGAAAKWQCKSVDVSLPGEQVLSDCLLVER
jgi:hypothetical protein